MTSKKLILIVSLLLSCVLGYWLYSHAFIEIVVSNPGNGEYTYVLINQSNGKRNETTSNNPKFKKFLRKGTYETLVKQGMRSHVTVKHSGSFLSTTKATVSLSEEHERSFVGNNPNTCMYFIVDRIASTPCNSFVEDLEIHMPATQTLATHTKKATGPAAFLEGLLTSADATQAVVNAEAEVDGAGKIHALYSVSKDGVFDPNSYQELGHLDSSKLYTFLPFDAGYAAISTDGLEALYYPSFSQTPVTLDIKKPERTDQSYRSATSDGDTIVVVYSSDLADHAEFDDPDGLKSHSEDVESTSKEESTSTVLLYSNKTSQQIEVPNSVIQATACGDKMLCLLFATGDMKVYEITSDSRELKFSLVGVRGIHQAQNNFYAITADGVLSLNTNKHEGYAVYSFGNYGYCGIAKDTSHLLICIADEEGNRRAININPINKATVPIDEKIAQLQKLRELKYVSVYGNYIHLAAELGRLEYQPSIGGYGYDPEIIKSTSAAISSEIKRLGIDTSKYTVVNPYQ